MALFCVALLRSIFGKLDIVAVASGKTVVNSRTKVIQTAILLVVCVVVVWRDRELFLTRPGRAIG